MENPRIYWSFLIFGGVNGKEADWINGLVDFWIVGIRVRATSSRSRGTNILRAGPSFAQKLRRADENESPLSLPRGLRLIKKGVSGICV